MSPRAPGPTDEVLRSLLASHPRIALVGASSRPDRPSHEVMEALLGQGHDVVPVNPREREVLGIQCYADLGSVPGRVQLVDVFRRPEATPAIAREAVEVGARCLWLQVGVVNEEAARIAGAAGLIVVMDRCVWVEHRRLIAGPLPGVSGAAAPTAPDPVGLCRDCRYARQVPSSRANYWLCRRASDDPSFPKYPRLPVRRCRGFEWGGEE